LFILKIDRSIDQPIEKFVKKLEEMKHPHEFIVYEKEGHVVGRVDPLKMSRISYLIMTQRHLLGRRGLNEIVRAIAH
jgi:hypothetical protein